MRRRVRVRGRGAARIVAYGVADAEHLVEKELTRLWPGARVRIERVSRADPAPRIVEEFDVSYLLEGEREVEAARPEEAASAAFRQLSAVLAGSRYSRTAWQEIAENRK